MDSEGPTQEEDFPLTDPTTATQGSNENRTGGETEGTMSGLGDSAAFSEDLRPFVTSPILRSEVLDLRSIPSTQLSVGSSRSPALRRGDIQPTGALDRYLASDLRSEIRPTSPATGGESSQHDTISAAPVIWGTTINIDNSMEMFRNFINNYSEDEMESPFFPDYLGHVSDLTNLPLAETEASLFHESRLL